MTTSSSTPAKGRLKTFLGETRILGNAFDILADPLERQYPKMIALLVIMSMSVILTSLMSWWGVGAFAIFHFVAIGVLAWAVAFKPKLLALVGVGGVIDGSLTDRDKTQESASWLTEYYYLFRRAFWVYTFLSIVPIVIPFVHSYVAYWLIVSVVLLQFGANVGDMRQPRVLRKGFVTIFSVVVLVIAIWMILPPYFKGVYFAYGSSTYTMEPDGSEIHHDRLAAHCKVVDGKLTGTTVPSAPEGSDCTSPYTGEPLKLVTPEAAAEHGIRPWTIASIRENLITLLETDWGIGGSSSGANNEDQEPVIEGGPKIYFNGHLGSMALGDDRKDGWIRHGDTVTVTDVGPGCLHIAERDVKMDQSKYPLTKFWLPTPGESTLTISKVREGVSGCGE